ncbi:hypothetical protein [Streptomyces chartreusis]
MSGARLIGVLVAASFLISAALLGLCRAGRALRTRLTRSSS